MEPCECKGLIRHERELREAWIKAHEDLHVTDSEALRIARNEINRRLDEMNKIREQISSERGEFVRRELYDREHSSLREAMDSRLKALEQAESNLDGRIWAVGAVVTIITLLSQLALRFLVK